MMPRSRCLYVAMLVVLCLLLTGCGQKGPLYHPGDPQAAKQYDPNGTYGENVQGDDARAPAADTGGTDDKRDDDPTDDAATGE